MVGMDAPDAAICATPWIRHVFAWPGVFVPSAISRLMQKCFNARRSSSGQLAESQTTASVEGWVEYLELSLRDRLAIAIGGRRGLVDALVFVGILLYLLVPARLLAGWVGSGATGVTVLPSIILWMALPMGAFWLARWQRRISRTYCRALLEHRCMACDYPLGAQPHVMCPECGQPDKWGFQPVPNWIRRGLTKRFEKRG